MSKGVGMTFSELVEELKRRQVEEERKEKESDSLEKA